MDINSLLSPSESPRETPAPNPPHPPPTKRARKTTKTSNVSSSTQASRPTSTPLQQSSSSSRHNSLLSIHSATQSPQILSPGPRANVTSTPPVEGLRTTRQPSTPGMDALADLASMQHHQQAARVNAGGLRNTEIYDTQTSSTNNLPAIPSIPVAQDSSVLRGPAFELAKQEAVPQAPSPRQLNASSLSEADQQRVIELSTDLASNPFSYQNHIHLINILHQDFLQHMRSYASGDAAQAARSYDLLKELQDARQAMDMRFSLGEDLLADWIQDQILLADTLDARVTVMELCQKAVEEERTSSKLWLIYAQWMLSLYRSANISEPGGHDSQEQTGPTRWREEDRIVAKEVFNWETVMGIWQEGARKTMLRIHDSHILWDPCTELMLGSIETTPSSQTPPDAVREMSVHFQNRLATPHATWDQTFQMYSSFVSNVAAKDDNKTYEATMVAVGKASKQAKQKYHIRDFKETVLQHASQQGDTAAELKAFNDYLEFEQTLHGKRSFDFDLLNSLFERATLRFPLDSDLWQRYLMFLTEEGLKNTHSQELILPTSEQAAKHCSWVGDLWAQYLLAAEASKLSFAVIEEIKHKATSDGSLNAASIQEVLKIHTAWCGFLRRRAFDVNATDEERDVAEVGIRSAIEDMETLGQSKYGEKYQGDPEFRLEKIYIKYFTQSQDWHAVREIYKRLIPRRGDSYDFWLRWYSWEMAVWGQFVNREGQPNGAKFSRPMDATNVLQQALSRATLDWPEKIIEMYQYHCEDHEDATHFQHSLPRIWSLRKSVQERRDQEAMIAYEANQAQAWQQQAEAGVNDVEMVDQSSASKRKREDGEQDVPVKRSREEDFEAIGVQDQGQTNESSVLKRDRENATVLVKNLAISTSEIKVRQFFRDCGHIKSIKMIPNTQNDSASAFVELESKDDGITALTKDKKTLDGRVLDISLSTGTTIFVCNYPSIANEKWMRDKFGEFGKITDCRLPSLKGDEHRRFCYVQFLTASQAQAATALDGEGQGNGIKLSVKISDPAHKQERHGAMAEGRELYLSNVNWDATEKDLKQAFSKYGKVESARILKKVNRQSQGTAFVVFQDREAATAALEMNLKNFQGRILNVSLSTNDKSKRQAKRNVESAPSSQRASDSPAPIRQASTNGHDDNATSKGPPKPSSSTAAEIQSRTLALMNIPDTVNDSRIRIKAQEYGELVRVKLRPDHQGAIVEFKEVASVGVAALSLEGWEVDPGRHVNVGTVAQLLKQKEERRGDKSEQPKSIPTSMNRPAHVRRPAQPGSRRGGKGGLGLKGSGMGWSGPRATNAGSEGPREANGSEEANVQGSKSNADFRKMLPPT